MSRVLLIAITAVFAACGTEDPVEPAEPAEPEAPAAEMPAAEMPAAEMPDPCAADDCDAEAPEAPVEEMPDACPQLSAEHVDGLLDLGARRLDEAPDWRLELPYMPTGCDIDCFNIAFDIFLFEAAEAGTYRFSTDLGDLSGGGACGPSNYDEFDNFAYAGRRSFQVELEAGEVTSIWSDVWMDVDGAWEALPETYWVQAERVAD